nr:transposase family protein [Rhizobium leguminosarum]
MLIAIRPASTASLCPVCGTRSERIHSRYQRRLADLPLVGKPVRLVIDARRFHCDAVLCGRRIFTERLTGTFSRLRRGQLPGSTTSFIISDLLWVAGQRPPLPKGSCCP